MELTKQECMRMTTIRLYTASRMTSPARDVRETTRACEYHSPVAITTNTCGPLL